MSVLLFGGHKSAAWWLSRRRGFSSRFTRTDVTVQSVYLVSKQLDSYSCLCHGNHRHNLKTTCREREVLLSVCVCCWCWAVSWLVRRRRRFGGISCSGWQSDRTMDSRRRQLKWTTDDPGTGSRPSVESSVGTTTLFQGTCHFLPRHSAPMVTSEHELLVIYCDHVLMWSCYRTSKFCDYFFRLLKKLHFTTFVSFVW